MKIKKQEEVAVAFQLIDSLINDGFEGNTEKETRFLTLALAIEEYEDTVLKLMPLTIK
jgi:HTH-type transcriptional regulator / antitoxin HigA